MREKIPEKFRGFLASTQAGLFESIELGISCEIDFLKK